MPLPNDPPGGVSYRVKTADTCGMFILERRVVSGSQFRVNQVAGNDRPFLELLGQAAATSEGAAYIP